MQAVHSGKSAERLQTYAFPHSSIFLRSIQFEILKDFFLHSFKMGHPNKTKEIPGMVKLLARLSRRGRNERLYRPLVIWVSLSTI